MKKSLSWPISAALPPLALLLFWPAAARADGPGLTAVPRVLVGNAGMPGRPTGCTVVRIAAAEGKRPAAVAAVDVRGGAPGSRETELLAPQNLVEEVHALVLAGGSAFGLDAASGAMRWLEEQGIGFDVGVAKVPIVPAAILFDLPVGGKPEIRPDAGCGYRAAAAAHGGPVEQGNVGAGAGATVGKLRGIETAMKGGLGSASLKLDSGLIVAALVAVNPFGDVIDPATGQVIAGVRDEKGRLADARRLLRGLPPAAAFTAESQARRTLPSGEPEGGTPSGLGSPPSPSAERGAGGRGLFFDNAAGRNTTLAIVATNAKLTKAQAQKVAQMAQDGLARAISPAHTPYDGDTVFVLATGDLEAAPNLAQLGALAADAVAESIVRAINAAESLPGLPAHRDLPQGDQP
jgi:L-aminopeptidase/D-esterase-like protein